MCDLIEGLGFRSESLGLGLFRGFIVGPIDIRNWGSQLTSRLVFRAPEPLASTLSATTLGLRIGKFRINNYMRLTVWEPSSAPSVSKRG